MTHDFVLFLAKTVELLYLMGFFIISVISPTVPPARRRPTGPPTPPRLSDDIWLWGGTAEDIEVTLRYGINNPQPDTHYAQMPAFGRDGRQGVMPAWQSRLSDAEIRMLALYVEGLHGTGRRMHNDPLSPVLGRRGLCRLGLGDRRKLASAHRGFHLTARMRGDRTRHGSRKAGLLHA